MGKLDDIFGRQYDKRLLVPIARTMKQEIKGLFLEQLKFTHTSDNDDELLDKIKQRIKEL